MEASCSRISWLGASCHSRLFRRETKRTTTTFKPDPPSSSHGRGVGRQNFVWAKAGISRHVRCLLGVNLWSRVSGALLGQNQKGRQNGSFLLGFLAETRFPSVSPRRRASKKSKEVYHEPEYDDSEPLLLGSITVPLFALRRRRQICLQLPLKQESETARRMYAPHFRGSERDLSRFLGL